MNAVKVNSDGIARTSIPSQPLSLRLNFTWNLFGNIVYAGCQWGILISLTKFTNVEMVGQFALGLAITAPVILFSQMGIRGAQATDAGDEYHFGHYLALRVSTTVMALLIIACIAFFGDYARSSVIVIILVGLSKAMESVADVYYGLLQRHERMDRIARSRMIKGILSLIFVSLVVYITRDVIWGILTLVVLWSAVFIVYDVRNARAVLNEHCERLQLHDFTVLSLTPVFNAQVLLRLFWLVLPLGFVQALISLKTNIPRYFIEAHWDASDLGIYTSLAYMIIVGNTLVSAMSQACVPRLSKHYAYDERDQYRKIIYWLMGIGVCIGCLGVLAAVISGRPLLTVIYSPEYGEHALLFILIMVVGAISYMVSILGYALMATRRFQLFMFPHILITAIAYIASKLLIPHYGLMGAAWACAITELCACIGMIALLVKTR